MARNEEEDSSLPFLLRVPVPGGPILLKAREVWPRTAKVYCHPAAEWPDGARHRRAGAGAVVRAPGRRHRPGARPRPREPLAVRLHPGPRPGGHLLADAPGRRGRPGPTSRCRRAGRRRHVLEIVVDSHERYPWTFSRQQATTTRRALPAGDYAVEVDGAIVAAVERKSLADLVTTLTTGKLRYLLADAGRRCPGRRSSSRTATRASSSSTTSGPGSWPTASPRPRCGSRRCRSCSARPGRSPRSGPTGSSGAALEHHHGDRAGTGRVADLPVAGPLPERPAAVGDIRAWARTAGYEVSAKGRIPARIVSAYNTAHQDR